MRFCDIYKPVCIIMCRQTVNYIYNQHIRCLYYNLVIFLLIFKVYVSKNVSYKNEYVIR